MPISSSRPASASAPSGSRSCASRWGTARTTVSAVSVSCGIRTLHVPSCARERAVTRALTSVRTPAASSALRASPSCSSPSGTRAQPMSAAPGAESRPVLNTIAASPSEHWPATALRVATPTRSHRASTARGDWPCAVSQLPKSCASRAGSARSSPLRASAARPTATRSARERCGYAARLRPRCSGTGSASRRSLPRRRPSGLATSTTGTSRRSCSGARALPPTRSRNQR